MSPIEPTGGPALARGSQSTTQAAFSARSGADKAQSLQAPATSAAAAPVETARAIAQAQAAQSTRLGAENRAPPPIAPAQASLAKPMTAVLLHELRLQQELADVREEKDQKVS